MGNQRQMLKGNIEKELVSKIEAAKSVLDQLNKGMEMSKQNCQDAKDEIETTSDLLKEMLLQRKNELVREVDSLHNAQMRPLQDAIKSTYITMGRLQSMLTHLESFDQSQLVNIRIPSVDTSFTVNEPAQISPSLECDKLKEDLKEWGNVTLDGFQCCMMDIPENPGQIEQCVSFTSGLPSANKENQEMPQKLTEPSQTPTMENLNMTWSIENWLCSKPTSKKMSLPISEDSKDEFFVVSPSSEDMDFVVPCQEEELDNKSSKSEVRFEDGESSSSIMCIERETQPRQNQQDDLSMWLKPKKTKLQQQQQPSKDQENPQSQVAQNVTLPISLIPTETDKQSISSSTSTKEKRILDFPCLLMDEENWIRKKKCKSSPASSTKNSFIESQQQQNLVPPAYALPNPFWLKKYKILC